MPEIELVARLRTRHRQRYAGVGLRGALTLVAVGSAIVVLVPLTQERTAGDTDYAVSPPVVATAPVDTEDTDTDTDTDAVDLRPAPRLTETPAPAVTQDAAPPAAPTPSSTPSSIPSPAPSPASSPASPAAGPDEPEEGQAMDPAPAPPTPSPSAKPATPEPSRLDRLLAPAQQLVLVTLGLLEDVEESLPVSRRASRR